MINEITEGYERWVNGRCKDYTDLNYSILALNGEAGEVAEWHKKYNLRGNPAGELTEQDLLEELGDVLFYLSRIAHLNGWSLETVMNANYKKIEKRVAEGNRSLA